MQQNDAVLIENDRDDAFSENSYNVDDLAESTIEVSNRAKIEYANLRDAGRDKMKKQKVAL